MNNAEPSPGDNIPDCPSWLDDGGRQEWMIVIPILNRMKVLTEAEYKVVAMYCDACARYIQAVEVLRADGNAVEVLDDDGNCKAYKTRVEVGIADRLLVSIKGYLCELGLTPAARTRIKVAGNDDKPVDKFAEYLKMRGDAVGT